MVRLRARARRSAVVAGARRLVARPTVLVTQMPAQSGRAARRRRNRQLRRTRGPPGGLSQGFGNGGGNPAVSAMSSAPAAASRVRRQSAPLVQMAANGERCVVRHREYVAEVSGSTAFATTSYVCQPALQTLFVWLQSIAGNFEKYRFRRLRFVFETENATSQAGSIIFSFDYDVLDAAPLSKQAMMSNKCSVRGAPWQEFALEVPVADMQRDFYYTRGGSVPSGADQKLYDAGNFIVASQNANGATGEIYVEYEIELITPQANVTPISGKVVGTAGMSSTSLFGSDAALQSGSNVGWSITSASTMTCTVAGDYLFSLRSTGTVITGPYVVGGTATETLATGVVNSAATEARTDFLVRAQVGQTFAPTITSATTITLCDLRIAKYLYSLS